MRNLAVVFALFLILGITHAQGGGSAAVFYERGTPSALVFIDMVSGEQHRVEVEGERFTVVDGGVLTFEPRTRAVKIIGADGRSRPHPFITLGDGDTRVDWAISADGKRIAWTVTGGSAQFGLTTVTRVADANGENSHVVYQETRTDGLRVKPVAFSPDDRTLYLDYQPDGLDALTVFPQYAGLFQLDLSSDDPAESFAFLPDEPGDFTGAGFGGGYFLRLAVSDQSGGFDLRVTELISNSEWVIPAARTGMSVAGDILVSPDGRSAVYAQASLQGIGTGAAQTETVIMRVDLAEMTQTPLTSAQEGVLRVVAWTDESSAVLLVNPARAGTWKVRLSDARVQQVAELSYIGQITGS